MVGLHQQHEKGVSGPRHRGTPERRPIFHTVFDLDDRYQVPGMQYVYSHGYTKKDGTSPRWRGIYDDRGRLMVAICHTWI